MVNRDLAYFLKLAIESLVASTSEVDCLERFVSEMTCYVSSGMLISASSLTHPKELYPSLALTSLQALR